MPEAKIKPAQGHEARRAAKKWAGEAWDEVSKMMAFHGKRDLIDAEHAEYLMLDALRVHLDAALKEADPFRQK